MNTRRLNAPTSSTFNDRSGAKSDRADSSERRNTVSSGGRLAGVLGLPETDVARVQRWCRARVPSMFAKRFVLMLKSPSAM